MDRFVVLGLWLVVFIDCGRGFATMGLGFAHGGGDSGLLHLVSIVLMVDWCYSLSTFFFFFFFLGVDGRLWVAGSGSVRCV